MSGKEFKNLDDVRQAAVAGEKIYWKNPGYTVILKGEDCYIKHIAGHITYLSDLCQPEDFFRDEQ